MPYILPMLLDLKKLASLANLATPILAALTVVVFWSNRSGAPEVGFISVVLIGGVISAVHHAEVIAAYVGRAISALILALAVTII